MSGYDDNVVRLRDHAPIEPLLSDLPKRCSVCDLIKPLTDFTKDPHVKSGRRARCRSCQRAEAAKYRAEHRAETIAATKRSRLKKLDQYRARALAWKQRNPDRISLHNKRYRQTEAGRKLVNALVSAWRARLRGAKGTYTAEEWLAQIERQKGKCYWCKRRFTKTRPPTKEHLIALSNNGDHATHNIVAACKPCNSRKKAKRWVLL